MTTIAKCKDLATTAAEALHQGYQFAESGWDTILAKANDLDQQSMNDDVWYAIKEVLADCNAQRPAISYFPTPDETRPFKAMQHRIGSTAHAIAVLLQNIGGIAESEQCSRVSVQMDQHSTNRYEKKLLDEHAEMINDTATFLSRPGMQYATATPIQLKLTALDYTHRGKILHWVNGPRSNIDAVCAGKICDQSGQPEDMGTHTVRYTEPQARIFTVRHVGMRKSYLGNPGQKEMAIVLAIDLLQKGIRENHGLRVALKMKP